MEINVHTLSLAQVDMLVAQLEGAVWNEDEQLWLWPQDRWSVNPPNYCTDPSYSSPIILQHGIHTGPVTYGPGSWYTTWWQAIIGHDPDGSEHLHKAQGQTHLEAAMRCYVIANLHRIATLPWMEMKNG